MSPESTRFLVERAQAGDTGAFESLVENYYGMVHGLALSRVGDWAAADDLTQDVFLMAWTNLARLRAPGAFLVWIRRIARNASLNWIRAREYRRRLADRHVQQNGGGIPVEPDPSCSAATQECLEHVTEALETLSPKLREAITLYYFEGHTAADAADALGISVDTMKKRLRLARAKLQRYYQVRQVEEIGQILPSRPRKRIEQIVAGLAIGPVMPEWAQRITSAAPRAAAVASNAASFGGVMIGAAASLTVLVGVEFQNAPQPASVEDMGFTSASTSISATQGVASIDGAVLGGYIVVKKSMPAVRPGERGLRPGDTIVGINGRAIDDLLDADGRGVLGVSGAPVTVTYIPADGDGNPRTISVIWPFDPERFGAPV